MDEEVQRLRDREAKAHADYRDKLLVAHLHDVGCFSYFHPGEGSPLVNFMELGSIPEAGSPPKAVSLLSLSFFGGDHVLGF